MKINSLYKHIDNGGVTVSVNQDDDENIHIEFDSTYFGYPNVSSVLCLGANLGTDYLKELGHMLIDSAIMIDSKQVKSCCCKNNVTLRKENYEQKI